jgi:hypothetical protein
MLSGICKINNALVDSASSKKFKIEEAYKTDIVFTGDVKYDFFRNKKFVRKVNLKTIKNVYICDGTKTPDCPFNIVDDYKKADLVVISKVKQVVNLGRFDIFEGGGYTIAAPMYSANNLLYPNARLKQEERWHVLNLASENYSKVLGFKVKHIKSGWISDIKEAEEFDILSNFNGPIITDSLFLRLVNRQNPPMDDEIFEFVVSLFRANTVSDVELALLTITNYNIKKYIGRICCEYIETDYRIREELHDSELIEYLSVYLNHHPASFTIDLYKYTYYRLLRVIPKDAKDLQYVKNCEIRAITQAYEDERQEDD